MATELPSGLRGVNAQGWQASELLVLSEQWPELPLQFLRQRKEGLCISLVNAE